jgi:hypothetical protein
MLPLLAIEMWYWGKDFRGRPVLARCFTIGLLMVLAVVIVDRLATNWGVVHF